MDFFFILVQYLVVGYNRFLTLYLTCLLAKSFSTTEAALYYHNRSVSWAKKNLCIFTCPGYVLFCIVKCVVLIVLFNVISDCRMHVTCVWTVIFIYTFTIAAIMTGLTCFILLKLRKGCKQTATTDHFQRLVILVAIVFCVTLIIDTICDCLIARYQFGRGTDFVLIAITAIAPLINSSANLFIYLAASKPFREAFVQLWKKSA